MRRGDRLRRAGPAACLLSFETSSAHGEVFLCRWPGLGKGRQAGCQARSPRAQHLGVHLGRPVTVTAVTGPRGVSCDPGPVGRKPAPHGRVLLSEVSS